MRKLAPLYFDVRIFIIFSYFSKYFKKKSFLELENVPIIFDLLATLKLQRS